MSAICFIITCLLATDITPPSDNTEVFSWHPDGCVVTLYDDSALTNKRIDLYPDINENMAGCTLLVDQQVNGSLRVYIEPLGYFYAAKGTLAVNTRNYDNNVFYLYASPSTNSKIIMESCKQQTVSVFGVYKGWLYVNAVTEDGQNIKGWLPPDMQCGNPYTTCN